MARDVDGFIGVLEVFPIGEGGRCHFGRGDCLANLLIPHPGPFEELRRWPRVATTGANNVRTQVRPVNGW